MSEITVSPSGQVGQSTPGVATPWRVIALFWLGGGALRMTFLAVPPVLPLIQDELRLGGTQVGVLIGLPVLMLSSGAILGALVTARWGAPLCIVVGLLVASVAAALRGVGAAGSLFLFTALMGLGVAAAQPAMATFVRQMMPARVGFGTAVYVNGLILSQVAPAALTHPLVLPLTGGSWRGSLVFWALPVLVIAILFLGRRNVGTSAHQPSGQAWWPDWRQPVLWRIGLLFGCTNAMYFGANAFIPGHLRHFGEAGNLTAALTALSFGQLPASLLLLFVADRLQGRRWPFVVLGSISAGALLWLMTGSGTFLVAASGVLGFACGASLILGFALPPTGMASGVFTISYALAVSTSVLGGVISDLTGSPAAAFLPLVMCALAQVGLAAYRRPLPRAL